MDDDVEEEFEVDINEAEPQFLQGQSSRSGVEVSGAKAFLEARNLNSRRRLSLPLNLYQMKLLS